MRSRRMIITNLGLLLIVLNLVFSGSAFGQYKSQYPDIPIVDVHVHPNNVGHAANFVKLSAAIKEQHGSNLAFWIALSDPGKATADQMKAACNNRMLFTASQMSPQRGLTMTAEQVIAKVQNDGYIGLKFWFGPPYRVLKDGQEGITKIDDPRFAEFFASLEKANILMTSLHIADPNGPFDNRSIWLKDPVYYWEQIRAFENVVAKYPNLTIVAAHGSWLMCQDAQIDFLRYMFAAYPNLNVDLSATFQYMSMANPDNLRDFFIEYQDRVLYGTDGGSVADDSINYFTGRYANTFEILETDHEVAIGFFGNKGNRPIQGLNLPKEVLEKIYYKNALKLYPGLKEAMAAAGQLPTGAE